MTRIYSRPKFDWTQRILRTHGCLRCVEAALHELHPEPDSQAVKERHQKQREKRVRQEHVEREHAEEKMHKQMGGVQKMLGGRGYRPCSCRRGGAGGGALYVTSSAL
eukprot:CAMPEP_0178982322 /NCGR_PEP_ID=MMETSP0795-20121207/433_1 /TAXON_ID=88552 /ORGANISM="Amoebophrya sp., Strain Ameob2" /LENGTH=106 /DNA_ID=CAMNT_0020672957 /DNA_START=527 /DNA_END=844 /DNA_ORIENTATION=+